MKKLLIAICLLSGIAGTSMAQQASKKPVEKATTAKPPTAKTVKPATTTATTVVPLKADGTPDKRFKENKATKAVPLKKDGTPDKRYKVNKKG